MFIKESKRFMEVFSKNIVNGYVGDDFGWNSKNPKSYLNGKVVRSIHVGWKNIPKNTKTLAIFCIDFDSIPTCGFPVVHWSVANIDPTWTELKENASLELKDKLIQGQNSSCSPFLNEQKKMNCSNDTVLFLGCGPRDKDHTYTLSVFALDIVLDLKNGFFANELLNQIQDHVIDKGILYFSYKKIVQ